jgi:hypothetical protein
MSRSRADPLSCHPDVDPSRTQQLVQPEVGQVALRDVEELFGQVVLEERERHILGQSHPPHVQNRGARLYPQP